MEDETPPPATRRQRRRIVLAAGACAVGSGAFFLAQQRYATTPWPHGAPLPVDVAGLPTGKLLTVAWQGSPVWVLRRSPDELASLAAGDGDLADPDSQASLQPPYARNAHRSLRPELFVAIGLCTHQGCVPARQGGQFLCPCHASRYDLAGRVFRSGPAPANLTVPAYRFAGDRLVIGEDA